MEVPVARESQILKIDVDPHKNLTPLRHELLLRPILLKLLKKFSFRQIIGLL